ncbi:YjgP/YjgQ family permease [bacterium]|nr:YjgP/YjgQ family permease [bacterium]
MSLGPLRILDWYLLRRQALCLAATATVVVTVSLIVVIVQDIDELLREEAGWSEAVAYFGLRAPQMLVQYLPVAVFLSVLVNLGILMRRGEVAAMMSAGVSHARITLPLAAFGVLVAVGGFAWNEALALPTEVRAEELWTTIKHGTPNPSSELSFMRGSGGRLYALAFVHRKRLHNFVMLEMGEGGFRSPRVALFARQAYWNHGQWNFLHGMLYRYDEGGRMVEAEPIGDQPISYPIEETAEDFSRYQQKTSDMTLEQLFHFMRVLRSVNESTADLWPQVHARFAVPASALVMTLLGAAVVLSSWEERRGRRVLLAILAAPAYAALMEVCLARAPAGPHLSAWIPNLLFGILGAILLKRSSSF